MVNVEKYLDYFIRHKNVPDLHGGVFDGKQAIAHVDYDYNHFNVDVFAPDKAVYNGISKNKALEILGKYEFDSVDI